MNSIIMYITDIVPYVIVFLPMFWIFRINIIRKKYLGKYNIYHEIALSIFVISLVGLFSQTIVPKFEFVNGKIRFATILEKFNFIPLKILYKTYIEVFKYSNITYFLINIVGNIFMFIPLGLLPPILYNKFKNIKNTVAFGCCISIFIEFTQMFLPRATDIDDVLLNTFGTLIGYLIFVVITKLFPKFVLKFQEINILSIIKEENKLKKQYALITGASSGIGYEMAVKLSNLGFSIIAVARTKEKLLSLKKRCNTNVDIICLDLSVKENLYSLYEQTKQKNITVLVNNAGFGIYGNFFDTDIDRDLNMIDLNIKCVHILTKLYLKDMLKKDIGYILNVSSSAAFIPAGPFMSTYYATKKYVLSLTNAIYEEIKKNKSNVCISSLCLGPTNTEFNKKASIHASLKQIDKEYVAENALKGLFHKKRVIIPGMINKFLKVVTRFIPDSLLIKINYNIQKKKKV